MATTIIGTGHDLPREVITNDDLAAVCADYDRARSGVSLDEWVWERIGIRSRHRTPRGEGTAAMATRACRRALELAGVTAEEVDLIVLSTFTSDHRLPQTISTVQADLGSTAKCIQLEAACAGFIDSMVVADALIGAGAHHTALVVHTEAMSAVTDPQRFLLNAIFGDGAGAVVVRDDPSGRTGLRATVTGTDGTKAQWLQAGGGTLSPITAERLADGAHFMQLDYKAVFDFAVEKMVESCRDAVGRTGDGLDDVDWVIAHQTGVNIIGAVADQLGLPTSKFLMTLDHTGNTSGATIPIALDEHHRLGALRPGDRVLMPAVGAGMAWGALYVTWALAPTANEVEPATAATIDLRPPATEPAAAVVGAGAPR
jgi:3-oxoacyl-[acyl-carrier-protein] synthase III